MDEISYSRTRENQNVIIDIIMNDGRIARRCEGDEQNK